jgi:AcrR family transcriptional regulator
MTTETTTKGNQTRQAIIAAAHTLFVRQGYHGTSMRQLAEEAGIALGGIYNHFSGKEDIFRAVFFEYHPYQEVLPAVEAAQGESVEEILHDAADLMIKAIEKRPHFLNLVFIEIVEFKSAHSQELLGDLLPRGMRILQRLKDSPDKLRSIPDPILIRAFIGLFFSYYLTDLILSDAAPEEFHHDAMEHFVDIYLHGILAKDSG